MPNYNLTEPFPSTATRIHSGRGGAGNTTSASSNSSRNRKSVTASSSSAPKSTPFVSGRGGAGNIHQASERAIFSFDEELERLNKAHNTVAPVCHIGRGGAGNHTKSHSSNSNRAGSVSSSDSGSAGKSSMDWVRNRFSRAS